MPGVNEFPAPFPSQPTKYAEASTVSGTSGPVTITAGGSANTKGSWTQLIASTSKKVIGLAIGFMSPTSAGKFLIDIGTGGAGSEVVLAPDLFYYSINLHGSFFLRGAPINACRSY